MSGVWCVLLIELIVLLSECYNGLDEITAAVLGCAKDTNILSLIRWLTTMRTNRYRLEPIVIHLVSEAMKTAENARILLSEAHLNHAMSCMRESVYVAYLRALQLPPPTFAISVYQYDDGTRVEVSKQQYVRLLREACRLGKHQVVFYMVSKCKDLASASNLDGKLVKHDSRCVRAWGMCAWVLVWVCLQGAYYVLRACLHTRMWLRLIITNCFFSRRYSSPHDSQM